MPPAHRRFLNRYVVEPTERVREGSFGRVLCALDEVTGERVALKLPLRPDEPRLVQALMNEAGAVASMSHPQVVPLLDHGWMDEAGPVLVFPWFAGGSLADRLRGPHRVDWDDALQVVDDLLGALAHVHGRGQIHRDVAPRNVLLARADGRLRAHLADLGVAKEQARLLREDTPLSPAFVEDRAVRPSRRSDIESVGEMAAALLTHAVQVSGESGGLLTPLTLEALLRAEYPDFWPDLIRVIEDHAISESATRVRRSVMRIAGRPSEGTLPVSPPRERDRTALPPSGHPLPLSRPKVDELLASTVEDAVSGEVVRVIGAPGSGKTAALDRLWLRLSASSDWGLHHIRVGDDGLARVVGSLDDAPRSPRVPITRMRHDPLVAAAARILERTATTRPATDSPSRVVFRLDGQGADAESFASDLEGLALHSPTEFLVLVEESTTAQPSDRLTVRVPPLSPEERRRILAAWVGTTRATSIDDRVRGEIQRGVAWARIESRPPAAAGFRIRQLDAEGITSALCGEADVRATRLAALWSLIALGDVAPPSALGSIFTAPHLTALRHLVEDAEALALMRTDGDGRVRWALPFPPEELLPVVEERLSRADLPEDSIIATLELVRGLAPSRTLSVLAGLARRALLEPRLRLVDIGHGVALDAASSQPASSSDLLRSVEQWSETLDLPPPLRVRRELARCAVAAALSNRIGEDLEARITALSDSVEVSPQARCQLHPLRVRLALERGQPDAAGPVVAAWLQDAKGDALELARVRTYSALTHLWRCDSTLGGPALRDLLRRAKAELAPALSSNRPSLGELASGGTRAGVVLQHGMVRVAERLRVLLGVLDAEELISMLDSTREACEVAVQYASAAHDRGLEAAALKEEAALLFLKRGSDSLDEVQNSLDRAKLAALRGGFPVEALQVENVRMDVYLRAGRLDLALACAVRQLANPRLTASPKLRLNAEVTACISRGVLPAEVRELVGSEGISRLSVVREALEWALSPTAPTRGRVMSWLAAATEANALSEVAWVIASATHGSPDLGDVADWTLRGLPRGPAWEALRGHLAAQSWPTVVSR